MSLLFWKTDRDRPGVVDSVAQQTDQAAAIAGIAGQELLHDPWANPAVRPYAEQLRNDQQRQLLGASHVRTSRRIRVTDRRAARAEEALEVLSDARATTSPARSVLELHHGRRRFMRIALGASLALSVGAGMGLNQLAIERYNAPEGVGFLAEIGLTGLSTAAILFRSHLSQYSTHDLKRWHSAVLIALMAVPLAVSCIGNAAAAGLAGIACSAGAAAFSLLSYVVAETSADAIAHQADKVGEEDEFKLQQTALDGDLFGSEKRSETRSVETGPDRSAIGSGDQVRDLPAIGSGTISPDRSQTTDRTGLESDQEDRSETGPAEKVTDPVLSETHGQVSDLSGSETSDPDPDRVQDRTGPERVCAEQSQTGPETEEKPRTKSRVSLQEKALERLDEAKAADDLYLAEHGRRIPAEKLARTLKIGKPVALELVKMLRGAHMDVAQ